MRHESSGILELDGKEVSEFTPSKPREKWLRKRTHVKLRVRCLYAAAPPHSGDADIQEITGLDSEAFQHYNKKSECFYLQGKSTKITLQRFRRMIT